MKTKHLFLAIVLTCMCMPARGTIYTGVCGENVTWSLDSETKVLTISGEGDMYHDNRYNDPENWKGQYLENFISSVVINEGVTSVGFWAFANCTKLSTVSLPEGITVVEDYAFYNTGLASVVLPNSVERVKQSAFRDCTALTRCDLGRGVKYIEQYILQGCTALEHLRWSDCLETISGIILDNFDAATSEYKDIPLQDTIYFPPSFRSMNSIATGNMPNMPAFVWNARHPADGAMSSPLNIGQTHGYYLKKIILGEDVESIPDYLLYGQKMDTIILPEKVTRIGKHAFDACGNLKHIVIPDAVNYIGECAFRGCAKLEKIDLPTSVTSLGKGTFSACSKLQRLDLPSAMTEIPEQLLANCYQLDSVYIPEGVTMIQAYAFYNCHVLHTVHIPDAVTKIDRSAFADCPLDSVALPSSLNVLGDDAFSRNKDSDYPCQKHLVLPDKLVATGSSTFSNWKQLERITIGKNVALLGENCFSADAAVTDITCYAPQPPLIYSNTFDGVPDAAVVHVLPASVESYKSAQYWSRFRIVAMDADEYIQNKVTVDAGETTANFTWPTDAEANSYQIDIYTDGEVFCKLTLGNRGQLLGIAFSAPGRNRQSAISNQQSATGEQQSESTQPYTLSFMVTGLDEASRYNYVLSTLDANGTPLHVYVGDFATTGYTGELNPDSGNEITPTPPIIPFDPESTNVTAVDNAMESAIHDGSYPAKSAQLLIRSGELLILHGDKTYTIQGQLKK